MASCGEVDHSVSSLPSSKKGNNNNGGGGGGGGSGNSAESSCSGSSNSSPALSVPECAICLQSCVHPVQLPCHHVFCFLCVKGASWQSKRCALCRQEVPDDFLERPTLLSPEELKASAGGRGGGGGVGGAASDHAWYYEGRNGWWQYDERTSRELEDAFSKGKKTAEMLIAGFLYVADLENMVQYRRNEHGRRRKMKRDVLDIPKKGVAGLRLDTEGVTGAVTGAAGRENSADGADTTVAGAPQQVAGIPSAAARPPTSLGGQPGGGGGGGPGLDDALSQLQLSPRPAPALERSEAGEGEEEDEEEEEEEEEEEVSPSRSSDPHTSVDESGSGDWSDDEEEEEEEDGEEKGGDGERVEPWEDRPSRQRLNPEDRSPPGAESASPPPSSGRSRMPDGQCTVTEV